MADRSEADALQASPSPPAFSAHSAADKTQEEQKECLIASAEQQHEPDWLHLPLTSGSRSFDGAEQLLHVSCCTSHTHSALPCAAQQESLTAFLYRCCVACQCVRDLHTTHDPEVTPYKSKYAARDILVSSSTLSPHYSHPQPLGSTSLANYRLNRDCNACINLLTGRCANQLQTAPSLPHVLLFLSLVLSHCSVRPSRSSGLLARCQSSRD